MLAEHTREQGPLAGHACLSTLVQGTVCKILDADDVKPHKVRYYLDRRDPDFAPKMAEVLCVYRQVKLLNKKPTRDAVAIVLEGSPRRYRSRRTGAAGCYRM